MLNRAFLFEEPIYITNIDLLLAVCAYIYTLINYVRPQGLVSESCSIVEMQQEVSIYNRQREPFFRTLSSGVYGTEKLLNSTSKLISSFSQAKLCLKKSYNVELFIAIWQDECKKLLDPSILKFMIQRVEESLDLQRLIEFFSNTQDKLVGEFVPTNRSTKNDNIWHLKRHLAPYSYYTELTHALFIETYANNHYISYLCPPEKNNQADRNIYQAKQFLFSIVDFWQLTPALREKVLSDEAMLLELGNDKASFKFKLAVKIDVNNNSFFIEDENKDVLYNISMKPKKLDYLLAKSMKKIVGSMVGENQKKQLHSKGKNTPRHLSHSKSYFKKSYR